MENLPIDILQSIALEATDQELKNLCQTNKKFQQICSQDYLWEQRVNRYLNKEEIDDLIKLKTQTKKSFRETYILFNSLKKLKSLKLFTDEISVHEMYKITELDLSYRRLTSIPKELGLLKNLQVLYLYENQLTSIPKELGNLINLYALYMSNNKLTSIPKELGNLKNLLRLGLSNNKLTSIPKELGNLTNLKVLDLSKNLLTSIPKELVNISSGTIDLTGNKSIKIPRELMNLASLKFYS